MLLCQSVSEWRMDGRWPEAICQTQAKKNIMRHATIMFHDYFWLVHHDKVSMKYTWNYYDVYTPYISANLLYWCFMHSNKEWVSEYDSIMDQEFRTWLQCYMDMISGLRS